MRNETRAQRYAAKADTALKLPFSFAAVNFTCDDNIAFLARALACFGGSTMHVIGKKIADNELNRLSGGHSRLVHFMYHSNPLAFIDWVRYSEAKLVVAELTNESKNIHEYRWEFDKHTIIALGNEMDGFPIELIINGEPVFIPMPGQGFCLNTSQTGNIFAYDFAQKWAKHKEGK